MRIFIGVLLIIVAVLALCAVIVLPVLPQLADNATIDTALASVLCQPNEQFERELYQMRDRDGTGFSMTPYCVNNEGQREDVTEKWVMVGVGLFIGPFIIGLFMIIFGANITARRKQNELFAGFPQVATGNGFTVINPSGTDAKHVQFQDGNLTVDGLNIRLSDLSPDKVEALKSRFQGASAGGDLTSKLKQLEAAKESGLITTSEYDQMRRKILDEMV